MRKITVAASAAVAAAAAAAFAAVPASASAAPATSTASCATFSQFQQVQAGQTVAQVQQEMGSAGTNAGMTEQNGFSTLELTWQSCSLLGLETFGVDFHANPNAPLLVLGKSALPRTTLG